MHEDDAEDCVSEAPTEDATDNQDDSHGHGHEVVDGDGDGKEGESHHFSLSFPLPLKSHHHQTPFLSPPVSVGQCLVFGRARQQRDEVWKVVEVSKATEASAVDGHVHEVRYEICVSPVEFSSLHGQSRFPGQHRIVLHYPQDWTKHNVEVVDERKHFRLFLLSWTSLHSHPMDIHDDQEEETSLWLSLSFALVGTVSAYPSIMKRMVSFVVKCVREDGQNWEEMTRMMHLIYSSSSSSSSSSPHHPRHHPHRREGYTGMSLDSDWQQTWGVDQLWHLLSGDLDLVVFAYLYEVDVVLYSHRSFPSRRVITPQDFIQRSSDACLQSDGLSDDGPSDGHTQPHPHSHGYQVKLLQMGHYYEPLYDDEVSGNTLPPVRKNCLLDSIEEIQKNHPNLGQTLLKMKKQVGIPL